MLEVSERDLDEISTIRLLIEVPSTVEVARVIEPELLDRLTELADEITTAAAEGELIQYLDLDRRFHVELLSRLENNRLDRPGRPAAPADAPLRPGSAGRIRAPRRDSPGAP